MNDERDMSGSFLFWPSKCTNYQFIIETISCVI